MARHIQRVPGGRHYTGFVCNEPIDILSQDYASLNKILERPLEKPREATKDLLAELKLPQMSINNLEEKGLIIRTLNAADGTVWAYELSDRGKEWWRNCTHRMRRILKQRLPRPWTAKRDTAKLF